MFFVQKSPHFQWSLLFSWSEIVLRGTWWSMWERLFNRNPLPLLNQTMVRILSVITEINFSSKNDNCVGMTHLPDHSLYTPFYIVLSFPVMKYLIWQLSLPLDFSFYFLLATLFVMSSHMRHPLLYWTYTILFYNIWYLCYL